ncbi:nitronate monooxygenase [Alphaproteobacteria bacterium]
MKALKPLVISGREVLPLIEGGKGIGVTDGKSSGAWAAAGAVGTFSGVSADFYDESGNLILPVYHKTIRKERHEELVQYAIRGAITQAQIAHEISNGQGCIHMNVLWGISSVEMMIEAVFERVSELIDGITCGAGLPFKLAEVASKYKVFYYPIISSARAFSLLWRRAYSSFKEWLGGVVYEDPWKAGGHNGLSNSENPDIPEPPYYRVAALRKVMREFGLHDVPIIMAGGVWSLKDWEDWIDNPELGSIAFQFGTRPLLTVESPISPAWKNKLLTLGEGDVCLNHFSPTGFYSSAVKNSFFYELQERASHQVSYSLEPTGENTILIHVGHNNRAVFLREEDSEKVKIWLAQGFTEALRTPDSTIIFVTPERSSQILTDQKNCAGCLLYCRFSNWCQDEKFAAGRIPDPRSYCIRQTLSSIIHGGSVENNLMFAGHSAHLFAQDPFYANGFVPTVKELIDRILEERKG